MLYIYACKYSNLSFREASYKPHRKNMPNYFVNTEIFSAKLRLLFSLQKSPSFLKLHNSASFPSVIIPGASVLSWGHTVPPAATHRCSRIHICNCPHRAHNNI